MWVTQPLVVPISEIEQLLQTEISELQNDDAARALFKCKETDMWLDDRVATKYPASCRAALKVIIPFPTTYLVESAFSVVNDLLTKKRNRLDITRRGDLRLRLTNLQPDIATLVRSHQSQMAR